MEARTNFTKDLIEVSATKEEWSKILKRIPWDASAETQELIEMLADQGVSYL